MHTKAADIRRSNKRQEKIKFLKGMLAYYEEVENYTACKSTYERLCKLQQKDPRHVFNQRRPASV